MVATAHADADADADADDEPRPSTSDGAQPGAAAVSQSQAASVAGNEGMGDEAAPGGAMANAGRTDATTSEDNNPRSMVWPLDPITLQRSGCSDGFENLDLTCPVSPAS